MAEKKKESKTQYNSLSDILKRDKLGENSEAENITKEITQSFYRPGGAVADMKISEAIAEFMNENYPEFGEKSLSFPEHAVDYGLSTQALVLTDRELDEVALPLDSKEKDKLKVFMKTQVKKGAVSEIEVFNWAKKCEDKLLMAIFWSFEQSNLQKLLGTKQENQELDVIVLLAKQRKCIIIEVKSDHSGKVPSNALTTLKQSKIFTNNLFNILGIKESENWEYIPLVALPNVESRDKLDKEYRTVYHKELDHILTKAELKTDLLQVIHLKENEYKDVSSYKTILSFLAASYHANAVKKDGIGVLQFDVKNLVLEASSKLVGPPQIQAGFEAVEKMEDNVTLSDLKNQPLAGFKGLMFWNKKQVEILMKMDKHEEEGTPCIIGGVWGTGKTLLLAYKAIKLSSENKKVVFISNLDSKWNKVITKNLVFEEKVRMNFKLNTNISFLTMKDIVNDSEEQNPNSDSILLQFIRKLVENGSHHVIIDELDVESEPLLLAELQAIPLGACSLTVALRGDTLNSELMEGRATVLKKIMRMSTLVSSPIMNGNLRFMIAPHQECARYVFKDSTVQHTVLGFAPDVTIASSTDELICNLLKDALPKVFRHPAVVILIQCEVLNIKAVVEVIRANTIKQTLAFTGDTSELKELRAFLKDPSGFLVTTPELFGGMEATSVIALLGTGFTLDSIYDSLNSLVRATTSLIVLKLHDTKK